MRGSDPMPLRTSSMSAPRRSARLASSFMNEMRVASIAFAAYLVSSAERTSIRKKRSRLRWNGAYSARMICTARSSSAPTTMRSGRIKSSTAAPSVRNSGFDTTAKGVSAPRLRSSSATAPRTLPAVPTGTVDLSTITRYSVMSRPMLRGTVPVELPRLESAVFAMVARQALRMAVYEIADELKVVAPFRGRDQELRLEQLVQAEQGLVAAQLVLHQLVSHLGALRVERRLEGDVEQVERRKAREVAAQERQPLPGVADRAMALEQALRDEREVGRVLLL